MPLEDNDPTSQVETEAMKLASAAMNLLSKIKAADPDSFAALERMKTYIVNRMELILAKPAKTGDPS